MSWSTRLGRITHRRGSCLVWVLALTWLAPAAVAQEGPVAMRGYSPVSLLNTRQWVKGREQYRATLDGAAYLLANERELQMFRASPERYAPALDGDCVVHFANTGERKAGLLRHGVVHENRLFFFASSEHKQAFVDNPPRYMNVDLALDGNCPVSLVELNRAVPGRPELAVVFGGFRYVFPGAQQREMFLAQPLRYAAAAHAITTGAAPARTAAEPSPPSTTIAQRGEEAPAVNEEPLEEPAGEEEVEHENELPPPAALSGYCPVTILDANRWVRGDPQFTAEQDGRRYIFAGQQERQSFVANPGRYVPALGGHCVVTFQDQGRRVEGSTFFGVIHRGRLFLFAGAPQKELFKENPGAYEDADLAQGGNCAVSRMDSGQIIEGKSEFTAWRDGMRYQFRGREELEKFLANPDRYTGSRNPFE